MKLLVITQKVDIDDDVLGFFHNWLRKLSPLVEELHVIANAVGAYDLPANVHVYSLGKEVGRGRLLRILRLWYFALRVLPRVDGIFVHMCPEYVRAIYPVNLLFRRPIAMWYAHVKVGTEAAWASKHVSKILSPSAESFVFDTEKLVATGHGIDTMLFSSVQLPGVRATKKILAISRISRVKNIEVLIEAARVLVSRGETGFSIDMYGKPARLEDDAYMDELKRSIEAYGLQAHFTWRGSIPQRNAPAAYRDADIFVRMQPGGGFGKTELEAMSCSVPAITPTPVYQKDLGEFADDLYFGEGDAEALAERISRVMAWDDARLARYRSLARSLVERHHNLDNVVRSIVTSLAA